MIREEKGNILKAEVEALVNPVNIVGVMGKGLALELKKAFPENYKIYREVCERKQLKMGKLLVTETGFFSPKYIINFPTKKHWKGRSKIEYIREGLKELRKIINSYEIKSIAIPALGCGNGGLNWNDVYKIILEELNGISENREIFVFPPYEEVSKITKPIQHKVRLTSKRAMLLLALNDYSKLGYAINLLVVQKTAYFLQRLGAELNLNFEKGFYGPYANNLLHLLKKLNGTYVLFNEESVKPDNEVLLLEVDETIKYGNENLSEKQKKILERLMQLFDGFQSPYGLELLATVDFLANNEKTNSIDEIEKKIQKWTRRKKKIMKPFHIKTALERLNEFYERGLLVNNFMSNKI